MKWQRWMHKRLVFLSSVFWMLAKNYIKIQIWGVHRVFYFLSLSFSHTHTKTHNYVLRACEWERAKDLTREYERTNGREMEVRCCGVRNREVCFCSFPWEDLTVKMVVINYMSCNIYLKKKKNPSPVSVKKHLSNCCIKINTAMQQTVTQPDRLRPATTDFINTKNSYSGFWPFPAPDPVQEIH